MQGAGAGVDTHRITRVRVTGELFFQGRDLAAEYKLAAFEHARDGGVNFGLELLILRGEIQEGNHASAYQKFTRQHSLRSYLSRDLRERAWYVNFCT